MKKLFVSIMAAIFLTSSAVYAEKETFLPEAQNDFVYTVLPSATPTPTTSPELTESPSPTVLPDVTPTPTVSPEVTATPMPTVTPRLATSDKFTADFTVEGLPRACELVFEIYDGQTLLDTKVYNLKSDEKIFSVVFNVPKYDAGKNFDIVCTSGAEGIRYYDTLYKKGTRVGLPTYCYNDENGQYITVFNAAVNIVLGKKINLYIENQPVTLTSAPQLINNTVMVPVREMSAVFGITDVVYNAEYNSVRVAAGVQEILFNIDYAWSSIGKKVVVDNALTQYINGCVYVPLYTLAEGLGSRTEEWVHEEYIDVLMTNSKYAPSAEKLEYIIRSNLNSDTDFLIWISKKNYEVNVFKKIGGVWQFLDVFPCAIGTDATPTCVGTYKYYEKIDRWLYPDFYVAPVMRFNKGYAIHSTLIKYDGTDYNPRVRRKLSHGCVRVQRDDMNWLFDNIPIYTTIHVTNE